MNTIDLTKGNSKDTIITGTGVVSEKFKPTAGMTGSFKAAADSASGHLVRRVWISKKPGGLPLSQFYSNGNRNTSDVNGVEPALRWTTGERTNIGQCVLEPNKLYYVNYSQHKFGAGKPPTSKAAIIRAVSVRRAAQ